jgi:hypothetical protein
MEHTLHAKPYFVRKQMLSIDEVLECLANVNKNHVAHRTAQKPKGGDVFVYQYQENANKSNQFIKYNLYWFCIYFIRIRKSEICCVSIS